MWRLPPLQPPILQEGAAMVIVVEPLVVRFLTHLMVQMNNWAPAVLGGRWWVVGGACASSPTSWCR